MCVGRIGSPETGVTCSCEPCDLLLKTKCRSFRRAANVLNAKPFLSAPEKFPINTKYYTDNILFRVCISWSMLQEKNMFSPS